MNIIMSVEGINEWVLRGVRRLCILPHNLNSFETTEILKMAGHNKWSKVKHIKAKEDKKEKHFQKLGEILPLLFDQVAIIRI